MAIFFAKKQIHSWGGGLGWWVGSDNVDVQLEVNLGTIFATDTNWILFEYF